MPSWNEKPHTTPLINVNLKPCTCGGPHFFRGVKEPVPHLQHCPAVQVLIPCPIPRSVSFEVVLGRCECAAQYRGVTGVGVSEPQGKHTESCPANPVKVFCSIDGETWEESHIDTCETEDGIGLITTEEHQLCDDRWGFIKSLVLGHSLEDCPEAIRNMRAQRDAVFAALCDMALAQKAHFEAHQRAVKAIGSPLLAVKDQRHYREMPVYRALEVYVDQLLEQVGVLR